MPVSTPRLFRLLFLGFAFVVEAKEAVVAEKERRGNTMVLSLVGAVKPKEASPCAGMADSACCRTSELRKATPL